MLTNSEGRRLVDLDLVRIAQSLPRRGEATDVETIVTEGNEKAGELAKDAAMLDGGEMVLRSFTVCSWLSLFGGGVA